MKNCVHLLMTAVVITSLGQTTFAQPDTPPVPPKENSPQGPILHIRDFLKQVQEKHDGYKSARKEFESADLRKDESSLALSPSLFGNVQNTNDSKPSMVATYDNVKTNAYQLGVSKTTNFGMTGKIYYSVADAQYKNLVVGSQTVSPRVVQASPVVELTLPLWRNWMGAETKNIVEQGEAQTSQARNMQIFQMKTVLVQSALAYWSLALARETMRVAQDAVERNSQLLKWHRNRVKDGLGDKVDVLQADAAWQTSVINLKNAKDTTEEAGRAFNLARNIHSPDVSEKLMPLTTDMIDKLPIPQRQPVRDDVKAAQDQTRVTKAAAELSEQKYKPTLEAYGSAALNNDDPADPTKALGGSFKTNKPTSVIGLRINAPLGLDTIHRSRDGWEKSKMAAEESYQRKLVEQENDWHVLNDKFKQTQERIHLYTDLEKKQKDKFDNERERRTAGRTTTQQVLLFENDYESAQISRIQALADFFSVYSQMKLYEEGTYELR